MSIELISIFSKTAHADEQQKHSPLAISSKRRSHQKRTNRQNLRSLIATKMGSKPFKSTEANLKRMKVLESTAVIKVKLMSLSLQKIFSEIDQLTPQEQLTVMKYLVDRVRNHLAPSQPLRKWSDLKGMAPYPLLGEDAQEWVSRTRREGDEHRERLLKRD